MLSRRKSLKKSSCVSRQRHCAVPSAYQKQWKSLISSPRFINNHLDFSNRLHREKLILVSHDLSLYTVDLLDLQNGPVPALMATELRSVPRANLVAGRCNGLITTALEENDAMFVINPITGQFMEMCTDPEEPIDDEGETEVVGVGCDSSTDDYTIVIIDWRDVEGAGRIRVADVASLRSNRCIEGIKLPSDYHVHNSSPTYSSAIYSFVTSVYLNGCVHWLCHRGSKSSWFIACFNPQNGKFGEIGLTDFVLAEKSLVVRPLLVVSGCLCVFIVRDNFFAQLWVMKEYPVRESWKKIPIYGLGTSTAEPLYLLGDREVVLAVDWAKDGVVVYNVDKKRMQKVKISGIPTPFGFWGTCVDSLVSPPPLHMGNKDDRPEAGFEG